ncbi:MAG TPA: hypothetical protein VNY52_00900 [Solirubrobacteraceae bacterium]|jgi:hypothetical protein|nr:hypothetical protein [Solirubrobacteraceae bacterium]
MSCAEAQRTLVKSPPELWAELSDPASLARHLGHFGEIRIARIKPETTVEWEADSVQGAVHLKPSGWGTKVTLSITRREPEPEAEAPSELEPKMESTPEPTATASETTDTETATTEPTPQLDPAAAAAEEPAPERRPRFFARFFRLRTRAQPIAETEEPQAQGGSPELTESQAEVSSPEPAEPTDLAAEGNLPEPAEPTDLAAEGNLPDPTEPTYLAAELAEIEETLAEQDATLLSDVLDRLGSAHHRPFSRG